MIVHAPAAPATGMPGAGFATPAATLLQPQAAALPATISSHYTPAGVAPDDPRLVRLTPAQLAALPTAPAPRRGPNSNPLLRLWC